MILKSCYVLFLIIEIYSYKVEVKLKQGKVIGLREETVTDGRYYYAFYSVPYARKPVGKLRFKDPLPIQKWKRPIDATVEYHGACAQAHIVHKHGILGYEDCLRLNIYTTHIPKDDTSELQPVAVWIHGYAFTSSMSHMFGGDSFLDKNIIFITVTHRVGVFGFLKSNFSSPDGNMGLKDIVMALKWIRRNVKHFGGDKKRITVMGNDSGATFLSLLLMSKNRHLFSNMILQSGAIFSPSLFRGNHELESDRLLSNLRKLGYKDLSTASTKDIISASQKIYNHKEIINFQRPIIPFQPVLDSFANKSLLAITPDEFYKKSDLKISKSILMGFNSAESISEAIPFLHNVRYLNYFKPFFKFMVPFSDGCVYNYTSKVYKKVAKLIENHYFKGGISEKSIHNFLQYTTDLRKYPIWKFIKKHVSLKGVKAFVYKFNYVGGFNAVKATSLAETNLKVKGASNGDEICYILKCEPMWDKYIKKNNATRPRDRKFMSEISEMWANFIRYGDPTPTARSGHITWPAMTLKDNNVLLLDKVTKVIHPKLEEETFSFWEDIYATYYANDRCNNKNGHEEL